MTVKRFIVLIFVLFGGVHSMNAQWDAQMSNYWVLKQTFNPAFAGQGNMLNLSALGRQQWVGITNAPKTFWISAEMPYRFMNKVHGLGLNISNDQIGLFSNTYIYGQYAYKKKIKSNTLNVGVQMGIASIGFDGTDLYNPTGEAFSSSDDAMVYSNEKSSTFDMGLGLTWIAKDYYVGLSASHLLEPNYDLGNNISSDIPRTYYLIAGGNINLSNPLYQLQPSTLVKYCGNVMQVDVTARFVYNKLFNVGASWRKDDGVVFMLGASIKGFNVGYSYDWSTSQISLASSGSHELYVTYSFPVNLGKGGKQSSKSVRIL